MTTECHPDPGHSSAQDSGTLWSARDVALEFDRSVGWARRTLARWRRQGRIQIITHNPITRAHLYSRAKIRAVRDADLAASSTPVIPGNDLLRQARERTPSPRNPQRPMSQRELADAVNTWLYQNTARTFAMDAAHIGKYERGEYRRPHRHYRRALCAVLAATDEELGFHRA